MKFLREGSVLEPVLYLLYTNHLPEFENNTVAIFVDDTVIFAVGSRNEEATGKLQTSVNQIQNLTKNGIPKLMN